MADMLADVRKVHSLTDGHPTRLLSSGRARRARAGIFSSHDRSAIGPAAPSTTRPRACSCFRARSTSRPAMRNRRQGDWAGWSRTSPTTASARRLLAAAQWRMDDARSAAATLWPIVDRPDADSYSLSLDGPRFRRDWAIRPRPRSILPAPPGPSRVHSPRSHPLDDREFAALLRAAGERPGDGPTQVRLISALLARGQAGGSPGPRALDPGRQSRRPRRPHTGRRRRSA